MTRPFIFTVADHTPTEQEVSDAVRTALTNAGLTSPLPRSDTLFGKRFATAVSVTVITCDVLCTVVLEPLICREIMVKTVSTRGYSH